jgi:hypothetical protein
VAEIIALALALALALAELEDRSLRVDGFLNGHPSPVLSIDAERADGLEQRLEIKELVRLGVSNVSHP